MKMVLVVDAVVLALAIIVWLLFCERTLVCYCQIVFILGAMVALLGYISESGAKPGVYDHTYLEAGSVSSTSYEGRKRLERDFMSSGYDAALPLYIAGSIAMAVAGGALVWMV
jgi:hypothetical protein